MRSGGASPKRVGAEGIDAYGLLTAIGRDCAGALQFIHHDDDHHHDDGDGKTIQGEPLSDGQIEKLLKGLAQAPLGLTRDDEFRISVADQQIVLKAQIFFWLIGATDGHAKNFSIFLGPGGTYHLTPLYDILTGQPSLDAGQIDQRQFRLAMSVGKNRHYRMHEIVGRHFVQTGEAAGLPRQLVRDALDEMAGRTEAALEQVRSELPRAFPSAIHQSVSQGALERAKKLRRPLIRTGFP